VIGFSCHAFRDEENVFFSPFSSYSLPRSGFKNVEVSHLDSFESVVV